MIATFLSAYFGTLLAILTTAWIISRRSKEDRDRDKIDAEVGQLQRAEITALQRETVRIMRENQVELKRVADAAAQMAKTRLTSPTNLSD